MEDDHVASARGDELPVASPKRAVGPPAILDQPRLADGVDRSVAHLEGATVGSGEDLSTTRDS
jgi:hypothetical protein